MYYFSADITHGAVLKIDNNIWAPLSTPALTKTRELEALRKDVETLSGPGEFVITLPEVIMTRNRNKNCFLYILLLK